MREKGMYPSSYTIGLLRTLCDTWPDSEDLVEAMLLSGLGAYDIFISIRMDMTACEGLAERISYEDVPCQLEDAICWALHDRARLGNRWSNDTETEEIIDQPPDSYNEE